MLHINSFFLIVLSLKNISVAMLCKDYLPKYNKKHSNLFIRHPEVKLVLHIQTLSLLLYIKLE